MECVVESHAATELVEHALSYGCCLSSTAMPCGFFCQCSRTKPPTRQASRGRDPCSLWLLGFVLLCRAACAISGTFKPEKALFAV